MNVRCTVLLLPIITLCAVAGLAAVPSSAIAFALAGTGDLDIEVGDDGDTCTIVALAGFDIVANERLGERRLIGFVEYGPDEAISGVCDVAGQLWFEVPVVRSTITESRLLDATDDGVLLGYEEWHAGGRTRFDGTPQDGWIDVTLVLRDGGDEILSVDIVMSILLIDNARVEERVVDGIMFAGVVPQANPYPTATGRDERSYVRRTGGGCTGESDVVVVTGPYAIDRTNSGSGCDDDPLYDDPSDSYTTSSSSGCESDSYNSGSSSDSGCERDSYNSSSSRDTSCEGDSLDDSSSSSSESMDCSSDDGSDDSSSSSLSDVDCEGDTFDEKSAGGLAIAMRRMAPRSATYYLRRTLHFWAPITFIVLGRRRRRSGM